MKKLLWQVLRHQAICRAPDEMQGFGSFGDGTNDGGGSGGGGQQPYNNGGFDNGFEQPGVQTPLIGQEEDADPNKTPLDDVWNAFAEEEDDGTGEGQQPGEGIASVSPEQISQMQTSVQQAIQNMRVPDDMIPENFDASDPTQLRALLNKTMQHTISQSLNVVFQPVQLAMKSMAATLQGEMDHKINNSTGNLKDSQILESVVPEINDPKYSGMIRAMDSTLKTKGKSAKERATALRKMLNQMGVQSTGGGNDRRTSNPNQPAGAPSIRTGHAALDSFFGALPKGRPPQQGNGGGNQGRR